MRLCRYQPFDPPPALVRPEVKGTLYRMFNADGDLLYLGISSRGPQRFGEHRQTQDWWTEVETIRVEHFATIGEAERAERAAIPIEEPRYNVVHRKREDSFTARVLDSFGQGGS